MLVLTVVVGFNTLPQVVCVADIALLRERNAANDVGVEHSVTEALRHKPRLCRGRSLCSLLPWRAFLRRKSSADTLGFLRKNGRG